MPQEMQLLAASAAVTVKWYFMLRRGSSESLPIPSFSCRGWARNLRRDVISPVLIAE